MVTLHSQPSRIHNPLTTFTCGCSRPTITLTNILYVPEATIDLLSLGRCVDGNLHPSFTKQDCSLIDNQGNLILMAARAKQGGCQARHKLRQLLMPPAALRHVTPAATRWWAAATVQLLRPRGLRWGRVWSCSSQVVSQRGVLSTACCRLAPPPPRWGTAHAACFFALCLTELQHGVQQGPLHAQACAQ